jgi:hypothetical protein
VPVILIDANMDGQGARIWGRMQSSYWRELTADLDVTCKRFQDVGLVKKAADDVVWRLCQASGFFLLTSNRNRKAEDSLEATIRREGSTTSLPVFTLPDPDRVYTSHEFLDRVVSKLLGFILDADNIRGTGRLFVP